MQFEKYRYLLFEKIQERLNCWFDQSTGVSHQELNLFLHSIQNAAKSLEMIELLQITSDIIEHNKNFVEKTWTKEELKVLLHDLARLNYLNELSPLYPQPKGNFREKDVALLHVIDEELSTILRLKEVLEKKGWMVIANSDPEKATSLYFDMHPDCLIIEMDLANKYSILEDIQKHNDHLFVPKIVISKKDDRETRISAYKRGADDFMTKPLDIEELIIHLEQHINRKKIYDQSILMDELTQVYNRKYLLKSMEKNLKELKRKNNALTIALLDIDNFSFINKKNGYEIGDQILVKFATFLNEQIRVCDTLYRLSGSQFLIEFPGTNAIDVKDIIIRLLGEFSKVLFEAEGSKFSVTFSTGIYQIDQMELLPTAIIHLADQALQIAKSKGTGKTEVVKSATATLYKNKLFISVIDNDSIIRSMLLKILEGLTFDYYELDIQAFEDGVTFFESHRLEERGEHFLIIEGVMPIMSGLEILQKVKLHKNKQRIRVFMLAGKKSESEIARALKLGADDYMTKPFSITELKARIERHIQRMM
jgi:two-component system, cell cycle response regulator